MDVTLAGPVALRVSAELYGSLLRPALSARFDGTEHQSSPLPVATMLSAHVLWALP